MKTKVIGREDELQRIQACIKARKNVLLEGAVGVGKTFLALAAAQETKAQVFRIDGDSRYTEQKLSGWFDPQAVIKKGFGKESFVPGPLVEAMRTGGILFINELNRLPEGVQNILLPAIDERLVSVPRLGEIRAKESFLVLATQNPKEFVATSHLSEAILDRFELIVLGYQPEEEETEIVSSAVFKTKKPNGEQARLPGASVRLIRMTRSHPRVRRGASIRAAISLSDLAFTFMNAGADFKEAFISAALMALPTRIEIEREAESERTPRAEVEKLIREWASLAMEAEKKKN